MSSHHASHGMRNAWLALLTLGVAGYAAIVGPAESRERAITFQAQSLYDLANRNERLRGNQAGVRAAKARVAADVARLAASSTSGRATLAALALLSRQVERHHVSFAGMVPAGVPNAPQRDGDDLTISLRGSYRNVLGALDELSRGDVLLEVRHVTLASVQDVAAPGTVDATIAATLYHGGAVLDPQPHAQTVVR